MKRLIVIALVGFLLWHGYNRYRSLHPPRAAAPGIAEIPASSPAIAPAQPESDSAGQFKCDGRTYCSQMTSCAEATYFLKNCPNVKMDGDNDGIPCEKQWCGR